MRKKILGVLLAAGLAASMAAGCGETSAAGDTAATQEAETAVTAADTEGEAETAAAETTETETAAAKITEDRAGNAITVPDTVTRIVSMAPSTTRVLIDLGVADRIVGIDTNSAAYADALPEGIPQFDMMTPDNEAITALSPDIVFTSGMSNAGGTDVFQGVRDAGICVADIPSSASFAGIEEDIQFIGDCVGASDGAAEIVDTMQEEVEKLRAAGETVPEEEKKTVLFEISIPTSDYPTIYTTGTGTYIDEMLTTVGAVNVCADQEGWVSLSEEDAIAMNPDVILTDVNYVDDPVGTILAAAGWENVTAVKNGAVYYVDADTSNQPNQHVVDAAVSIAKDIYPDTFADWEDPLADLNAPYNTGEAGETATESATEEPAA